MITFQKYLVYILSTLLLISAIIFMPATADALSAIYAVTIGAFLGIDIATGILKTKKLPDGEFQPIHKDRYIVCSILSSIVIAVAIIVEQKTKVQLIGTLTTLSMTLMAIGAMFIGALEGTKLVTGVKIETPTESK